MANKIRKFFFLTVVAVLVFSPLNPLGAEKKKKDSGRFSIVPVGAPYYTPDTGWGLGVYAVMVIDPAAGASFNTPDEITFYCTGTLKKQVSAGVMPEIFFASGKLKISGTVEASRYPASFWGIGPGTSSESEEVYTPIEVFADCNILFRVTGSWFLGPALHFRYRRMETAEEDGLLVKGTIPGSTEGQEAGGGIALFSDTRDSIFYPLSGWYLESVALFHHHYTGSSENFIRLDFDLRYYLRLCGEHVLAFQVASVFSWGSVPFQSMGSLGGNSFMRGLLQNRFLDHFSTAMQVEYRFPLFWRIAGVLFAAAGEVQGNIADYSFRDIEYCGGTGLRVIIDRKKHIAARLDCGFDSDGTPGFYFLVKEAF